MKQFSQKLKMRSANSVTGGSAPSKGKGREA